MQVIRSPLVHGVSVLTEDDDPVAVLAGPVEEISDTQIAEQTKALLHRRQWLQLHHELFGGMPPHALLTSVVAVLVVAVIVTAAVMGVIWTLQRRPASPPLIDDRRPPAASQLAPSTISPGGLALGNGDQAVVDADRAGASRSGSGGSVPPATVPPTTTGPIRGVVGEHPIRSAVGEHPVRSVVGTNPVRGAVSTVSTVVSGAGHTASSVLCTVLCPPTTTGPS